MNPYARQSDQALRDRSILDQGIEWRPAFRGARPATISTRSASFTEADSSGVSRNQGQNTTHQARPMAARIQNGVRHVPNCANNGAMTSGITAPPSRPEVQISPWAVPRIVTGSQSAV